MRHAARQGPHGLALTAMSKSKGEGMSAHKREVLVRRAYGGYQMGETAPDVARRLGVSVQTLCRRWRQNGWRIRPRGWACRLRNPKIERDALRLSEKGHTVAEVANRLGVKPSMVERIRRDAGFVSQVYGASKAPGRQVRQYDREGVLTAKWCPACARMLPPIEFWKNRWAHDGLQSHCRECQSAARRARGAS